MNGTTALATMPIRSIPPIMTAPAAAASTTPVKTGGML